MQSQCFAKISGASSRRSTAACASRNLQESVADTGASYRTKSLAAGDNVGCLLRGVQRHEVERGMVLAKPGSITTHTKFEAKLYVLSKDDGGRHTPFLRGYKPQFYIRTADVTGQFIDFRDEDAEDGSGRQMVLPGDIVICTVELGKNTPIEEGQRFAIREGKRTVGAGFITKILG